MDLRKKWGNTGGSGLNPNIPLRGEAESDNDPAEELVIGVAQSAIPIENGTSEVDHVAPETKGSPSPSTGLTVDGQGPAISTPTPESTHADTSLDCTSVDTSPNSSEAEVSAMTEVGHFNISGPDENASSLHPKIADPTIAAETPAERGTGQDSSLFTPVSPCSSPPSNKPEPEIKSPYFNRGKGTIETIEDICRSSLEGINILILRGSERDNETIRQLESDKTQLEQRIQELVSERDELNLNCFDWSQSYKTLKEQFDTASPYEKIFSQSLPSWLSLEKLGSFIQFSSEDVTEYKNDAKIVWRVLSPYINLVEDLKSGTLAPRQLTSATDAFSEAICSHFENDAERITNWHEYANEHLKQAGYYFMILATGAQIDSDLMTGSIQGKTIVGTIKRMALIKDGGDVIRKADVNGV